MENRGKLLTLDEVLQHVLESEDEYNEPDSTDDSLKKMLYVVWIQEKRWKICT